MNSLSASNQLVEEMLSHLKPPIPVVDWDANSTVASFYANRSVFITGATGFIGKALIEKLVRSCEGIKRIYILVREKRGKSVKERLSDLIKAQCFDRIRETHGGSSRLLEEKLFAIRGDITQAKFGIGADDMRLLSEECTIVINSAATIRFVEPIDIAVKNNIYSVGQLVQFCNELKHLEALIHLSTAYSNCHKRDTIYEIFYEPPMRGDQIQESIAKLRDIQAQIHVYPEPSGNEHEADHCSSHGSNGADKGGFNVLNSHRSACKLQYFYNDGLKFSPCNNSSAFNDTNSSGDSSSADNKQQQQQQHPKDSSQRNETSRSPGYDLLDEFTRIALRRSNRPNTYAFTKAISENYLLDKTRARPDRYLNDKIPVAIVRPSIVGGAWREPMVGLVDNYNGPTGAILSLYTGALQAMPGGGKRVADLVPVDMVTNMVLCTGWFLVEQSKASANACNSTRDATVVGSPGSRIKQDNGVYLFNFVSGFRNPLHWHQVTDLIAELAYKYPSKYMARLPSSYFIRAGRLYEWYDLLNQKLPAYLVDLVKSKLLGQRVEGRSSLMAGYARIKQMTDTLTPFTSNQWKLSDANTQALYDSLDQVDKKVFHFDVASIDWGEYLRSYIIGSRIYTLRDEPKNVPAAMLMLQRRRALNAISIGTLIVLIYWFLIRGSLLLESSPLGDVL